MFSKIYQLIFCENCPSRVGLILGLLSPRFCFSLFILKDLWDLAAPKFYPFFQEKIFLLDTNDNCKSFINRWKIRLHFCQSKPLLSWTKSVHDFWSEKESVQPFVRLFLMEFCTSFSALLLLWLRGIHSGKQAPRFM